MAMGRLKSFAVEPHTAQGGGGSLNTAGLQAIASQHCEPSLLVTAVLFMSCRDEIATGTINITIDTHVCTRVTMATQTYNYGNHRYTCMYEVYTAMDARIHVKVTMDTMYLLR